MAATSTAHPSTRPAGVVTRVRPRSYLVGRPLAEQAVGAEDEDQDQDREDDGVRPSGGDVLVAPRGEEPDEEAAEGGAWHVTDPAEHGGGERAQPGLIPHPPH